MSIERLHFDKDEMPYHAMHIADHLTRYSYLRSACRGKNILDVACGEGYGCSLLSKGGAASVVGIDISSEAIAKAKSIFPADNISYIIGDVCQLEHLLPKNSKFDIICSFETIEHIQDPKAFLLSLASLRADSGIVVISAPNDYIMTSDQNNPYHLRRYTYALLKEETEAILGPATSWLLGTPIQGYTLLKESQATATPPDADLRFGLEYQAVGTLGLIPPQANLNVDADTVLFWIGTWGKLSNDFSVASPLSMKAFLEPWQAIEYYKRLDTSKDAEIRNIENTLAEERRLNASKDVEIRNLEGALTEERHINASKDTEMRSLENTLSEERRTSLDICQRLHNYERLNASKDAEMRSLENTLAEERRTSLDVCQRLHNYECLNASKDAEMRSLENTLAEERRTSLDICQRLAELESNNKSIKFLVRQMCKNICFMLLRYIPADKILKRLPRFSPLDNILNRVRRFLYH